PEIRVFWRRVEFAAAAPMVYLRAKSATMSPLKSKMAANPVSAVKHLPKHPKIKGINEVGRYAIGVQWLDGHDSIFPLESLRRRCPCNECGGDVAGTVPGDHQRLLQLSRLGESGMFLSWADGHETLYTLAQLREICRCAYCAGEPEKPITGG
ncbi:MAG: hypothetical protein QOK03_293, partial [Candidatus Binataceae bacterium]|nr:hypothetical protein [Candidatus Binataceae bacterium]